MGERFRSFFENIRLSSVILVALGAVLLINPDFGSKALTLTIGWILVIAGAIGLGVSFYARMAFGLGTAGTSLVMLLAGILMLSRPLMLASLFGIVMGGYLVFTGVGSFADARRLRSVGQPWTLGMIWAVGSVLVGVILILSPMTSSRMVMSVAGIAMIVCGVGSVVTHARLRRFLREQSHLFDRLDDSSDDIIDV